VTSSFVIGANQWQSNEGHNDETFADLLISTFTIPLSDNSEDGNQLPVLFKDPSEDGSVVLNYFPSFITFKFVPNHNSFYPTEKIKDPFLNIFSPPPQI
jgi:hypothetical protein